MLNTICGMILASQVQACRVTLEQATVDYTKMLNVKVEKLKREVEAELPQYTKYSILAANVIYERRATLTSGPLNLNVSQNGATCILRWTF